MKKIVKILQIFVTVIVTFIGYYLIWKGEQDKGLICLLQAQISILFLMIVNKEN